MKNLFFTVCSLMLLTAAGLHAQETTQQNKKWMFRTRIIMTGSSDQSDPIGYLVYSAFAVEPSISRELTKILSLEFNARTESHEVDFSEDSETSEDVPLGSVELLPVNLLVRATAPFKGSLHPYIGAGANMTFCWEKSGTLNSTDLTPSFGAALQLGADINISSNILFNINVGWNSLRTDIKDKEVKIASLKIDPISIGLGIGFRF